MANFKNELALAVKKESNPIMATTVYGQNATKKDKKKVLSYNAGYGVPEAEYRRCLNSAFMFNVAALKIF